MIFYRNLEKYRNSLNKNEEKILKYILTYSGELKNLTINDIAHKFYTVPNTITRLVKKLNFNGFTDFKNELKKIRTVDEQKIHYTSLIKQITKTEQLMNHEVADTIINKIHSADKILIFAVGLSRFPAEEFSERFKIVGKNCETFIDPHLMKHHARLVNENDIALAISLSGTVSSNVISAMNRASLSNATTISITGFSNNKLSNITNYQLYGYSKEKVIDGIDIAERVSLTFIINYLFNEYIKKYYN